MMFFNGKYVPEELEEAMRRSSVWTPECPVSMNELAYIKVLYYDFEGRHCEGEVISHSEIKEQILGLFGELCAKKFPINKVMTIDRYGGDDEASMADNNSSCFNFRKIMGTDRFSNHSYGLAIDINPLQNPYIIDPGTAEEQVFPKGGEEYLDRTNIRPGMVEPVVDIFAKYGFEVWGGKWDSPKDYHHFQYSDENMKEILTRD